MATQVRSKPNVLYDEDFYAWSREQAGLLRDGRFADLDLEHLIEEVADLGGALKRSVRSRIRTIIEHLLKLEHSPVQDPRGGWYDTIIAQRSDLVDERTPEHPPRDRDGVRRDLRSGARRRGDVAAQAQRAGRRRPAACHLPLQPRPGHRRLVALSIWGALATPRDASGQSTGGWCPWGARAEVPDGA